MPRRIHLIGRKNSGKTTLVAELVAHWRAQGHRIGTIKHTHHHHELDTPGKDSHRHHQAGAAVVGIVARQASAVFWSADQDDPKQDRYAAMAPMFAGCDLVIVEGDSQTDAPKIEVWRAASGETPYSATDPTILALVTDDPVEVDAPCLPRSQVSKLAVWLWSELEA